MSAYVFGKGVFGNGKLQRRQVSEAVLPAAGEPPCFSIAVRRFRVPESAGIQESFFRPDPAAHLPLQFRQLIQNAIHQLDGLRDMPPGSREPGLAESALEGFHPLSGGDRGPDPLYFGDALVSHIEEDH